MKHFKIKTVTFLCAMLLVSANSDAQSISDIFNNKTVSGILGSVTGEVTSNSPINVVGTWNYQGSACDFKTDNLLKKAGGAVAATTVESKLNTQCAKLGIKSGKFSYTFNNDSTFTHIYGSKTYKGIYSLNQKAKTISLKYYSLMGFNAQVENSNGNLSLLFDANKLLKLLTLMSSASSNTTLKTVGAIAGQYDGMLLGFDLKKK